MSTSFTVTEATYHVASEKGRMTASEFTLQLQPEDLQTLCEKLRTELGEHCAIVTKYKRSQGKKVAQLILTIEVSRRHLKSFLRDKSPQLLAALLRDGWL